MRKGLAKVFGKGGNPDYSSNLRHLQKAWLTGLAKVPITTTVPAWACNETAWHQTMPRDASALSRNDAAFGMQGYHLGVKHGGAGVKPCSVCMMEDLYGMCGAQGSTRALRRFSCASSIAGGTLTGLAKVPIATTVPGLACNRAALA